MNIFKSVSDLFGKVSDNIEFVIVFLAVIVGVFCVAYLAERLIQKKHGVKEKVLTTRKMAMIGMFSAISGVLMYFEFPLPMIAPPFYELDFSELPVLICGYAFGPLAGVITEFLKVLIKLFLKSTSTAFVGDLANFAVGCTMILPATIIYHCKKKKKIAVVSCIVGTLCMTVFGTAFNAIYLLPTFADMFFGANGRAIIIDMGSSIHAAIDSFTTLALFCVAPLNLIKGTAISVLTMLLYKPLSPIIKEGQRKHR